MIRKKVLGIGVCSATLLVQDTEANNELRVLRRINVTGWEEKDIAEAQLLYTTIQNAGLPALVRVHAVLLQNSFLNVVSSYCAGGDLCTHLEDDLRAPLQETLVLRWMLVIAYALRRLHTNTKLSFYGLTLAHIFIDRQSGVEGITIGLPVPRSSYLRSLEERRADGVNVQREYPPEVIESKSYHPVLSDIWHLGLVGSHLLSSQTSLRSRSDAARRLIADMMAPQLSKRCTLDSVIATLSQIAGEVRMPPARPLTPTTPAGVTVSSFAAPLDSSSPLRSSGNEAVAKGTVGSPPNLVLKGNARSAAAKTQQQQPQQVSAPSGGSSSASPQGSPHDYPQAAKQRAPQDSWRRKALEQFDELQKLNASPVPRRNNSRNASPAMRRATPNPHTQQQQPNKNSQSGSLLYTLHGSRRLSESPMPSGIASGAVTPRGRPHQQQQQHHQQPLDNNTRALNEMFAERDERIQKRAQMKQNMEARRCRHREEARQVLGLHQQHEDNLKNIREGSADADRSHGLQRRLQAWRMKNPTADAAGDTQTTGTEEEEDDDVRALAAQHHRPSSRLQSPAPMVGQKRIVYKKNATVPVTIVAPKGSRPCYYQSSDTEDKENASTGASGTAESPNFDQSIQTTPLLRSPPVPSPLQKTSGGATPPREPPTHRSHVTGASGKPQVPATRAVGGGPGSKRVDPNAGERAAPSSSCPQSPERHSEQQPRSRASGGASGDMAALATLEWAVDGLRSSVRGLVKDPTAYGETMLTISDFAHKTAEERFSARHNEAFMRRIKGIIVDNRAFAAAAPLCAQLVALEGMNASLRGL